MAENEAVIRFRRGYERCVVTFIDILGFRTLLARSTASEVRHILQLLEQFTGTEVVVAERMDEVRLYSQAFAHSVSDAMVRVRTIDTQYADGAFCQELIDLSNAQIALVDSGVLIRGGMSVGDIHVGYNGEGPVFGLGLVRAYEIESQEAIYPRIVVDAAALDLHRTDRQLRSENNTDEFEVRFVEEMLATGEDGTRFIDYLRVARRQIEGLPAYILFLARHAALLRNEFAQNHTHRTRRKIEWLRRYHNRNIRREIQVIQTDAASEAAANLECGTSAIAALREAIVTTTA